VRTGFVGEGRIGLLNDLRFGERRLPRMLDRCVALALPAAAPTPAELPVPELRVPLSEVAEWRARMALPAERPAIALAPGAVGPSKRWSASRYAELARRLTAGGHSVWVVGGPGERQVAAEIACVALAKVRDLTGPDLRNAIIALAAADAAVSNDSGLLHVAAALGTPVIGIFGPTSPWHWAPLNPLAAVIQSAGELSCRPCHRPVCRVGHHRCMEEIPVERIVTAVRHAVGGASEALASHHSVMAGPGPVHVLPDAREDVDARDKRRHDKEKRSGLL
jgi:heptosyltransferase-2